VGFSACFFFFFNIEYLIFSFVLRGRRAFFNIDFYEWCFYFFFFLSPILNT